MHLAILFAGILIVTKSSLAIESAQNSTNIDDVIVQEDISTNDSSSNHTTATIVSNSAHENFKAQSPGSILLPPPEPSEPNPETIAAELTPEEALPTLSIKNLSITSSADSDQNKTMDSKKPSEPKPTTVLSNVEEQRVLPENTSSAFVATGTISAGPEITENSSVITMHKQGVSTETAIAEDLHASETLDNVTTVLTEYNASSTSKNAMSTNLTTVQTVLEETSSSSFASNVPGLSSNTEPTKAPLTNTTTSAEEPPTIITTIHSEITNATLVPVVTVTEKQTTVNKSTPQVTEETMNIVSTSSGTESGPNVSSSFAEAYTSVASGEVQRNYSEHVPDSVEESLSLSVHSTRSTSLEINMTVAQQSVSPTSDNSSAILSESEAMNITSAVMPNNLSTTVPSIPSHVDEISYSSKTISTMTPEAGSSGTDPSFTDLLTAAVGSGHYEEGEVTAEFAPLLQETNVTTTEITLLTEQFVNVTTSLIHPPEVGPDGGSEEVSKSDLLNGGVSSSTAFVPAETEVLTEDSNDISKLSSGNGTTPTDFTTASTSLDHSFSPINQNDSIEETASNGTVEVTASSGVARGSKMIHFTDHSPDSVTEKTTAISSSAAETMTQTREEHISITEWTSHWVESSTEGRETEKIITNEETERTEIYEKTATDWGETETTFDKTVSGGEDLEVSTPSKESDREISKHHEDLVQSEYSNSVTVIFKVPENQPMGVFWYEERNYNFRDVVINSINFHESRGWNELNNDYMNSEESNYNIQWVRRKREHKQILQTEDLIYIAPSPMAEDRQIYVAFFVRNGSTSDPVDVVPGYKTYHAINSSRAELESRIGLNVTQITSGIILVRYMESFFVRHAIIFTALLAVAMFCICVIIFGLIYIRCKNLRGKWDRSEFGDKSKLNMDIRLSRDVGDLHSDHDIQNDEGGAISGQKNGHCLNGNSMHVVSLNDQDGWLVPMEETIPTASAAPDSAAPTPKEQHAEDTKL